MTRRWLKSQNTLLLENFIATVDWQCCYIRGRCSHVCCTKQGKKKHLYFMGNYLAPQNVWRYNRGVWEPEVVINEFNCILFLLSVLHGITLRYECTCFVTFNCYNDVIPFLNQLVECVWNLMAHGDAREGKWRGNWRTEWVASTLTLPRNVVYPALLKLMRTPRLPAFDWTDASAVLNGLVRFGERRNLVSARVPSRFKSSLPAYTYIHCTRAGRSSYIGTPDDSAQMDCILVHWYVYNKAIGMEGMGPTAESVWKSYC